MRQGADQPGTPVERLGVPGAALDREAFLLDPDGWMFMYQLPACQATSGWHALGDGAVTDRTT